MPLRAVGVAEAELSSPSRREQASRDDVLRQLGSAVPLELGKAVVRVLMEQLGYLENVCDPDRPDRLDVMSQRVVLCDPVLVCRRDRGNVQPIVYYREF